MRFELTGGIVKVQVKREGEELDTETISATEFGGAEGGPEFSRDNDGVWSYGGIFKVFRNGYTVVVEAAFVEHSRREFAIRISDVTVTSAKILPNDDEEDDLTYELDYTDDEF